MAFSGWSTTAASNTAAATGVNFDENQAPSTVNNSAREMMAQLKAAVADLTGTQTLTNKTVNLSNNTLTGTTAQFNTANSDADFYTTGGTDVAVADGGTGVSSLTANNVILGNGTSPVQFVAPGTSGNVLLSNGTTWASTAPTQGTTKLNSGSATAATHDIVMTAYTAYTNKILVIDYLPATDNTNILFRTSTDGGSTYDAGASDYDYLIDGSSTTGPGVVNDHVAGATAILLNIDDAGTTRISNASDATRFSAVIHIRDTTSARRTGIHWSAVYQTSAGNFVGCTGRGRRTLGQDTDAVRILSSSGNSTLTWALYGYN